MEHAPAHAHPEPTLEPKAIQHDAKVGQQHPLGIYFAIWALLFILSTFSYLVDYFQLHGFARWSLILIFMFLKAGLIVAVFMHMKWERLALMLAILIPPLLLAVLVALMSMESDYTFWTRIIYFGLGSHS
jgi:cytochrome c oxidase subunit IV